MRSASQIIANLHTKTISNYGTIYTSTISIAHNSAKQENEHKFKVLEKIEAVCYTTRFFKIALEILEHPASRGGAAVHTARAGLRLA